jgi:hypothetical protein
MIAIVGNEVRRTEKWAVQIPAGGREPWESDEYGYFPLAYAQKYGTYLGAENDDTGSVDVTYFDSVASAEDSRTGRVDEDGNAILLGGYLDGCDLRAIGNVVDLLTRAMDDEQSYSHPTRRVMHEVLDALLDYMHPDTAWSMFKVAE